LIIKEELEEVKRKHADPRRTELMVGEVLSLEDEDLIEEADVLITLSNQGYIKRLAQDEFQAQKRGGRGVQGTGVKDDDFVRELVSTSTHDHLLFFTNKGRVYRLKGYEIPEYGRTAKGLPVVNLLKLEENESIQTIINVTKDQVADHYLFFATRQGIVKRTNVNEFSNIRQNGLKALNLKDDDELINVFLTDGQADVIMGTKFGYSVRFAETDVRNMGRTATGVRGIKLREGDHLVGATIVSDDQEVLVLSEKGYGKRTPASEYPTKGRGGKGIITLKVADKNGPLAGLTTVQGNEDIMVITDTGVIIRTSIANISQTGRSTMGVKVMRLDEEAKIMTFALVDAADQKDQEE
jgi:DNA gyrase subunit A